MRISLVEGLGYVFDTSPLTFLELKTKAIYKIALRRYVAKELSETTVLLKNQPTAQGSESMLKRMGDSLRRLGYDLDVDDDVADEVQTKREYAEERSRAGVEIKALDPKYETFFSQYKSVVNEAFERHLRPQQMRDSFFMCAMSKSGNFSVPGSGKTASVLGVYAYLEAKGQASRIVVVCPKNAFESWRNEFIACFGKKKRLREFSVQAKGFSGLPRSERKRRMKVDTGGCNLILVNYESAPTYVEELKSLVKSKALLVFDEVHRVKRVGGKFASAALDVSSVSDRTIALTGTPIPNSYLDVYNFLHILFPREYDAFFNFSTTLLSNPSDAEISSINARLQPFFCRTTKDDLGVPPANEDIILRIDVDPDTEHVLDVLKMRYRKNKLALMLRVMQLETDPLLLLRDLDTSEYSWLLNEDEETGEIDYVDYSDEIVDMIRGLPPSQKADACVAKATDLATQGKPVIVWCVFVNSIRHLQYKLSSMGLVARSVFGETPQDVREKTLEEFRSGLIDALITNPHTLAESVSLHSVCHDAIYYEYSFNLVHLLQSKDRIHRLGLPDGQYTQYYYLQDYYNNFNNDFSLDANIYKRLQDKEQTMLDAIADRKLEVMPTTEEDLEAIFANLFEI